MSISRNFFSRTLKLGTIKVKTTISTAHEPEQHSKKPFPLLSLKWWKKAKRKKNRRGLTIR